MPPRRIPKPPPEPAPPPPSPALTEEEAAFVRHYLSLRNNTRAYLRVHPDVSYASANTLGAQIAGRPHVRAEIDAASEAYAAHLGVHAEAVLREYARVAFADPVDLTGPDGRVLPLGDVPIDLRRAVQSYRVNREKVVRRTTVRGGETKIETTVSEQVVEIRLWNKNDALNKLANYLNIKVSDAPKIEALIALLPEALQQKLRPFLEAAVAPQ